MNTARRRGYKVPQRQPTAIDAHVGARLRQIRTMRGISQGQLAALLGLTFQQVQKYERGSNRMSASRLYQLAGALETPVAWFFEDLAVKRPSRGKVAIDPSAQESAESWDRETLEFIRLYRQIDDKKLRQKLYSIAKALATR